MKTAYENNKELIQEQGQIMSYDGKDYETWRFSAREKLSEWLGMDKFVNDAFLFFYRCNVNTMLMTLTIFP